MQQPIADSDPEPPHPDIPVRAIDDRPREACGVFGIWAPEVDVAVETFYGIHTLQHRGQESAGICTTDGRRLTVKTGMGLVAQVFDEESAAELEGIAAIGHTRYSTTGASRFRNAQPILLDDPLTGEQMAIAHNGNVVNAAQVRVELSENGATFETSTDTEVLAKYLLLFGDDEEEIDEVWETRFSALMRHIEVAYSLVLLTPDRLMAARDPYGVRPLCIGEVGGRYVVASETCALDQLGATLLREVRPGE
ncbi:MAG: amidophosphoribosyltransferase, partial [Chloroflexi bacterium]|nr:amidophosphoribosyltransferase [Chloroflexota bacterium]